METLAANTGPVREISLHGRQWLVAPLTLIVPGVLNGSNGPLLYPREEVARDPQAWNGMPLVVYHPTDKLGNNVSGRSPDVLASSDVGRAYNAHVEEGTGKLKAEGWFDVEALKRVDSRVLASLRAGKAVELSTGLFTDNVPAVPNSKTDSGVPYSFIARNYRPDHVAVLPDVRGACSVLDGCGVNVNVWSDEARAAALEARRAHGGVARGMVAKHPFPGVPPVLPMGALNPAERAKNPSLAEALRQHQEHLDKYHRAFVAEAVHRQIENPSPKDVPLPPVDAADKIKVGRAKKALERAGEAHADVATLSADSPFAGHQAAVAASVPGGHQAVDAARAEAIARRDHAVEVARQHIAGLPDQHREKGRKALTKVLSANRRRRTVLTENNWSDAAREAAAAARKAKGGASHADQASSKAIKASAQAKGKDEHLLAADLHSKAAQAHLTAARRARLTHGMMGGGYADLHHSAFLHHTKAAHEHYLASSGKAPVTNLDADGWMVNVWESVLFGEEAGSLFLTSNADPMLLFRLQNALRSFGSDAFVADAADGCVYYTQGSKAYRLPYREVKTAGIMQIVLGQEPPTEVRKVGGYWRRNGSALDYATPSSEVGTTNEKPSPKPGANQAEGDVNREQAIGWLTTNCQCWKGAKGRDALSILSDPELKTVLDGQRSAADDRAVLNAARKVFAPGSRLTVNASGGASVVNADGEQPVDWNKLAKFLGVEVNLTQDPVGGINALKAKLQSIVEMLSGSNPTEDAIDAGADDAMEATTMSANRSSLRESVPITGGAGGGRSRTVPVAVPVRQPQTDAEWLEQAPPTVRSAVQNAMEVERRERQGILNQLCGGLADQGQRQAVFNALKDKPLGELRTLLALRPAQAEISSPTTIPDYSGAAGGPLLANFSATDGDDEADLLPLPTTNWEEVAAGQRAKGKRAVN